MLTSLGGIFGRLGRYALLPSLLVSNDTGGETAIWSSQNMLFARFDGPHGVDAAESRRF